MPKKHYLSKRRKRTKQSTAMKKVWERRQSLQGPGPVQECMQVEQDIAVDSSCSVNQENPSESTVPEEGSSTCTPMLSKTLQADVPIDTNPSKEHDPWDPQNDFESIAGHSLCYEKFSGEGPKPVLSGKRIVDINHILSTTLKIQYYHTRQCTFGQLEPHFEKRHGLSSMITLKCTFCGKMKVISTETSDDKVSYGVTNTAFVWGTLSSGSSYTQTKDLLSLLDIPALNYPTFRRIEENLGNTWKDTLWESMREAGKEELEIATSKRQLTHDGTPWITVHADGGWSKRSYGHSYNALSGAAVIIGKETGKVLYLGVRNKYCCLCARAANLKQHPPEHQCFKNWSGSSTAMEADIIVQGFKISVEMHGLKYIELIADGDASVYSKIQKEVEYGAQVRKIEYINHLIKNYGKALHKIKIDLNVSPRARKILTFEKIKKLQNIIMYCSKENIDPDVFKTDVSNSIYHVFGDHSMCSSRYCNTVGLQNIPLKEELMSSGLIYHLEYVLESVLSKAHKLIKYENNNKSEAFMSLLAKCNSGKRLNLVQRQSFEVRAYLAGLRYNSGLRWQLKSFKETTGRDVGEVLQSRILEHNRQKEKRKRYGRKRMKRFTTDTEYGPNAEQPLLSKTEYISEYQRRLNNLQVTKEQQWELAIATIGQFQNSVFLKQRAFRLTASNFGQIIKRRTTNCSPLLKRILYAKAISTPAMEYGKNYEAVGRRKFEETVGVPVQSCGLFVDVEYGFLAASPDGLVGEDELLEVKCAYSLKQKGYTITDAIHNIKQFYLKFNEYGTPVLKSNHNYYYQIQGQLHITNRKVCNFVVYIDENQPLFIQRIERDENMWRTCMLPKLKEFYLGCFLPEKIQQFISRGITCTHIPPTV